MKKQPLFQSRRILLSLVFMILLFTAGTALAQTTALRVSHLIDPESGAVTQNQIILIKGRQILEVGTDVAVPEGAEVIDLSNAWVMPGLMDAHTHITLDGLSASMPLEIIYLRATTAMRALLGLKTAQDILQTGFTVVRDVGNDANYSAVDVRDAIRRGWFTGPTVLTSGKIIGPFGGQSARISPEQGPFWLYEYIDADSVDEVRKAVRQNIYYGADCIKLVADNSAFYYSIDEIKAAVEESHAAGRPVSVHVMGGEAAWNVILGGADSIEHGFHLSDKLLELMKEKGTWLVGTDFPEAHLRRMMYPGAKKEAARIIDRLKRAHKIGVRMAFGSDSVSNLPGKNRGEMMLDYLDVWQAAGVPPAATLKAMTTNAAELLGIEKQRGSIAKGMAADIIATPANPLEDIQALRKVVFVMKDGKVVKNTTP